MYNCLVRLLNLWDSSSKYFLVYPPNSASPWDKKTIETDRYKKLAKFFKGTSGVRNNIRVCFLIFLNNNIFWPFQIVLQAQKPMIHQLYIRSVVLMKEVSNLVLKEGKIPSNTIHLADLELDETIL